jgi:amidase
MEAHLAQIERVNPKVNAIRSSRRKRTELYHRVRKFMETYEFLILPVSQVPPFDVKQRYVQEINGEKMETYIDWMKTCYYITTTGFPAISVPCGFTKDGLPVGIQIVGGTRTTWGYCSWLMPLSRPPVFGNKSHQWFFKNIQLVNLRLICPVGGLDRFHCQK